MADPKVIEPGERLALDAFADCCPHESPVVFDVGANAGDWTAEVLERIPKSHVVCFEPQGDAAAELLTRVEGYDVEVLNLGLSDKEGERTFYADRWPKAYRAGIERHPEIGPVARTFTAWVDTLTSFCDSTNINHINLLKLDVEGHEMAIIQGAHHMLVEKQIDVLQFEFNECAAGAGWTFAQMWNYLASRGFNRFYLEQEDGLEAILYHRDHEEPKPLRNYLVVRDTCEWWRD